MLQSRTARVLILLLVIVAAGAVVWILKPVRREAAFWLATNGYIDQARVVYHSLASQGDPLGENNYAVLIDNNRYRAEAEAEKNKWYTEVYRYYESAAAAGLPAARYNLGSMTHDQSHKAPPADQQWYKTAGEEGDAMAQLIYARNFDRKLKNQDYRDRLDLMKRIADGGDAEAQYRYGDEMYFVGNEPEADRYFRQAAEQGHFEATGRWGIRLLQSGGPSGEIVRWLTIAAERGDIEAQEALGELYRDGDRVPRDYAQAAHWYAMAADLANVHERFTRLYRLDPAGFRCCYWIGGAIYPNVRESASYELAQLYLAGNGVPKDVEKAKHYLELPAKICWKEACDLMQQLGAGN